MALRPDLAPHLAQLLDYPSAATADQAARVVELAEGSPEIGAALAAFRAEALALGPGPLAERFTRTFDLAPRCVPYLGIQLFGEDGPKRARLMVGIATACHEAGLDRGREVPDHVGVALRLWPLLPGGEREDFAELCLAPALAAMESRLDEIGDPYRHVVRAARLAVAVAAPAAAEAAHA